MKRFIVAFTAGQALQLLILFVAQGLTYATNLFLLCAILGAAAALMLLLGSIITALEAIPDEDMDETQPLPKELNVTNDKVERVPRPEAVKEEVEAIFRKGTKA